MHQKKVTKWKDCKNATKDKIRNESKKEGIKLAWKSNLNWVTILNAITNYIEGNIEIGQKKYKDQIKKDRKIKGPMFKHENSK